MKGVQNGYVEVVGGAKQSMDNSVESGLAGLQGVESSVVYSNDNSDVGDADVFVGEVQGQAREEVDMKAAELDGSYEEDGLGQTYG